MANNPTLVTLADGTEYMIPSGQPGTFPWVRQASQIAVAYHQLGADGEAYAWTREYEKRRSIWDRAQAGADLAAIIAAAEPDLLAPLRILYNLLTHGADTVLDLAHEAINWAKWLPVLLAGGLVIAGIGLYRGSVTVRR